jgi:flagellar biosynthesis/type III secretory pathway protein FliH
MGAVLTQLVANGAEGLRLVTNVQQVQADLQQTLSLLAAAEQRAKQLEEELRDANAEHTIRLTEATNIAFNKGYSQGKAEAETTVRFKAAAIIEYALAEYTFNSESNRVELLREWDANKR